MEQIEPIIDPHWDRDQVQREAAREYLFDMICQMAHLARQSGERYVAIHLEAIIAARRAVADDRPA